MKISFIHLLMMLMSGVLTLLIVGCSPPADQDRINISQALSSSPEKECFKTATFPAQIEFPRDSGPHEGFQTEWWYYTGNLETAQGRQFGYQLTFFRRALACEPVRGKSKWRAQGLYFAHFAVTDVREDTFVSDFRMNRQSLGIAGATRLPYTVWIDDWRVEQVNDRQVLSAGGKSTRIRLELFEEKPVILQGKDGWSRKGPGTGDASYYYSRPRLRTEGTLEIGSDTYAISGTSWFDHEWSTSALGTDVAGWDWFSVHLDDGRDLMVCRIRQKDGTSNGYGFGSISFPDNTYEILSQDAFFIQPRGYWTSPVTGRKYPSGWKISLPGYGLDLTAVPLVKDQEHTHMFAYWEGAVRFFGMGPAGKGPAGMGYVELTGY
jgi:predicted secreted hydrolase